MKITGFTVIIVLFNVLAHHLASITEHTITRIDEVDWKDKMPSFPENKCSISSGPFQAQKGYHKAVGTDHNPIYLSNGEKDHQVLIFNASDRDQQYMLRDQSQENRFLYKNIHPKETHVAELLGSEFSFSLHNLDTYM
jgi:hypothetical protein